MKIEKINENQIKCTLNKHDLASRQIKASELAYGSEKAKLLFKDMMRQASVEFGFYAEDLPLMIEAIPIPGESIILIITKVEDPEELDTRFSSFSPGSSDDEDELLDEDEAYFDDIEDIEEEESSELIDMFTQAKEKINSMSSSQSTFTPLSDIIKQKDLAGRQKNNRIKSAAMDNITRVYSFDNLDSIILLSGYLDGIYNGQNSLYKSPKNNHYYLIMHKSSHAIQEFSMICNMISEFGKTEDYSSVGEAFYKEHFNKIISRRALQKLQTINNTGGFNNGSDN